jgi:hypothetical protein
MLEDLEALAPAKRPRRILMIRLERLGRGDGLEAMEAFLRIRRLGIVVHTRIDGDVGYDRASELLMPVLRFFIGGMENEVRRDKLLSSYERRREARKTDPTLAVGGAVPYGLVIVDRHLVPQEPEASAVRFAYDLRLQGYGSHVIGKRMASVAPPMTFRSGLVFDQKWNADRVRRLIIKEIYRYTIVDEQTWYRAQRPAREVSRKTIFHEYNLRGALRCECGYALVGSYNKKTKLAHYFCRQLAQHNGRMRFHRANRIEEQFLAMLSRLSADDALLRRFADSSKSDSNAEVLRTQLAGLRGELSRFEDRRRQLFQAFEEGALRREDLQWRLDDLKAKEGDLEAKFATLEADLRSALAAKVKIDDLRALVASAPDLWKAAEYEDRTALSKVISRALGGLVVTFSGELKIGSLVPERPRPHRYSNHRETKAP